MRIGCLICFRFYSYTDPCPGYRKYAEVAYKCQPNQFKSRIVCHSDKLELSCSDDGDSDDDLRLAIYSAAFSSAAGSHIYCPVRKISYDYAGDDDGVGGGVGKYGVSDVAKCESSYATEAVMQMCHGRSEWREYRVSFGKINDRLARLNSEKLCLNLYYYYAMHMHLVILSQLNVALL